MDYGYYEDPALTKIKQEYEDIDEDVPDFVKIVPGELKRLPLNRFEFVSAGDGNLPNIIVKQEIDTNVHEKQDMDVAIKANILKTKDFPEERMIKTEREDSTDHNGAAEEWPFKSDKAHKQEEQLPYHIQKHHTDSSDSCGSGSGSGYRSGSDSELAPHSLSNCKINDSDEQTKLICLNVYKNLQLQNEVQNIPKESADSIMRETAYLTEIPYSRICEIVQEDMEIAKNRCELGQSGQQNV